MLPRLVMTWLSLSLVWSVGACSQDGASACSADAECMHDGMAGTCEPNMQCSFPDDTCASGKIFGPTAGDLAGRCVPGVGEGTGDPMPSQTDAGEQTSMNATSGVVSGGDTTLGPATGNDSATTSDTTGVVPGDTPNGEPCGQNADCQSLACFMIDVIKGGVCGECLVDDDCRFGCSPPRLIDFLAGKSPGSMCNDGTLGAGCQTDAACASADLHCALIGNSPLVASVGACSSCVTSQDCPGAQVCNAEIDQGLTQWLQCVTPGTLADGASCSPGASGNAACANLCASVDDPFGQEFGVCSECLDDTDCAFSGSCDGAYFTGRSFEPGVCF